MPAHVALTITHRRIDSKTAVKLARFKQLNAEETCFAAMPSRTSRRMANCRSMLKKFQFRTSIRLACRQAQAAQHRTVQLPPGASGKPSSRLCTRCHGMAMVQVVAVCAAQCLTWSDTFSFRAQQAAATTVSLRPPTVYTLYVFHVRINHHGQELHTASAIDRRRTPLAK